MDSTCAKVAGLDVHHKTIPCAVPGGSVFHKTISRWVLAHSSRRNWALTRPADDLRHHELQVVRRQ